MTHQLPVLASILFLCPAILVGQTNHNFDETTGNWEDAASWDTNSVPENGDSAFINNGGVATLSSNTSTVVDIGIGQGTGTLGTLNHSAGTLDSSSGWIRIGGDSGTGAYNMTGMAALTATHMFPGDQRIFIGHNNGGTGGDGMVLMEDDSSIMTSGQVNIADGALSSGRLSMSDNASIVADGQVRIGDGAMPVGSLTMSDNAMVMTTNQIAVATGEMAVGSLEMSGNTSIMSGGLDIGQSSALIGTLDVSDNAMIVTFSMNFGSPNATVNVNQTGGSVTSNEWIGLGNFGGGNVTYDISGGSLIATNNAFSIGEDGSASLNVSGTADVQANGQEMFIGRNNNSSGTLQITGACASVSVTNLRLDTADNNSATMSFIADADGVSPIVSSGNTEFGDNAILVVDLSADDDFGSYGTKGTPLEILLIDNASAVVGAFVGLGEGALVGIGGGKTATISYVGGMDGNDVVLDVFVEETECDFALGDVNQDGSVDFLDIQPFVDLLNMPGSFQCEADVNQDGAVDFLDIDPFVELLGGP